jgi:hypothetical protein
MSSTDSTDNSGDASGDGNGDQTSTYRTGPDRANLLPAALMLGLSLIGIAYTPLLAWLPILPLLFIAYILRSRTTVDGRGITARYMLRPGRSLVWDDFKALRFTRGGKALAVRTDGTSFPLPGVSFNSLVTLAEVTGGRIPDPVTPGVTASDDKVKVVNRDSGDTVLMDKDDYSDYEARRRTATLAREELRRREEEKRRGDDGA